MRIVSETVCPSHSTQNKQTNKQTNNRQTGMMIQTSKKEHSNKANVTSFDGYVKGIVDYRRKEKQLDDDDDDDDIEQQEKGRISSSDNEENNNNTTFKVNYDHITNGNYFAIGTLVVLIVTIASISGSIACIFKHGGLRNFKWNENFVAAYYDKNQMHLDPELSARRALNIHALTGFAFVIICSFQIILTFFFTSKKGTTNKTDTDTDMKTSEQQKEQEPKPGKEISTESQERFLSLSNDVARRWHRYTGRFVMILWVIIWAAGVTYFLTAATNRGLHIMKNDRHYYHTEDSQNKDGSGQHDVSYNLSVSEKLTRAYVFLMFLFVGTSSIVNGFVGYFVLALRKKDSRTKKHYLIHKSCMAFAFIIPFSISVAKLTVMAVQLYIGPSTCVLGSTGVAACFGVAYIIQCTVLVASIYKYDKQLFRLRSVKWNTIVFSLLTLLVLASTAFNLMYRPSDGSCFATNSPL